MTLQKTNSDRLLGASVLPRSIIVPVSNSVDLGLVYTGRRRPGRSVHFRSGKSLGVGTPVPLNQLVRFLARGNVLSQVDGSRHVWIYGTSPFANRADVEVQPVLRIFLPEVVRNLFIAVVTNHH